MSVGAPSAVGIDIGGTKMLGVVIDPDDPGHVRREVRMATPRGGEAILAGLVELIDRLDVDVAATVGLGIPGLVDRSDVLRMGPNLPGVVDLAIGSLLTEVRGTPVAVDNDATCAAIAELRGGAARGADVALVCTLGTGIGGGIVSGGRILHGANGFAGEPGHMIVDPRGPLCPCGQRGCWERYASGSGLGAMAREAAVAERLRAVVARAGGDPEAVRGEHVVAAAREGDVEAGIVLDEFAWWVGVGVANLINVLDPDLVVLGGGVMEAHDVLIDRIRAAVPGLVLAPGHRPAVAIEVAHFGEQAGAIGAALLGAGLD